MSPSLLDVLVPQACVACRAPGRWPLCGACRRALPFLESSECCRRCGLPQHPGRECPARGASFLGAWAPFAHEGPARALVVALKYGGGRALADVLAASMAANAPRDTFRDTVLVPVPAAPARARRRGYNQALVLAEAVAARTRTPVADVLRRRRSQTSQVGAGRKARAAAAESSQIACRGTAPEHCLLVDDVHTTGATLDACARVLRAAGAATVAAMTATRTLTERTVVAVLSRAYDG